MTTRSSSSRSDDSLIPPTPATAVLTRRDGPRDDHARYGDPERGPVHTAVAPEPDATAEVAPAGPAGRLVKRLRAGRVPGAEARVRGAALLVFLCGAAHAPRFWAGLSHGALGATLVASALCMLLALALPARAAQARLVAATAAAGVTAALAAGQVLGGRFGLPDPTRLWAATLAPPWLAGTAATAAALAALMVAPVAVAQDTAPAAAGAGSGHRR